MRYTLCGSMLERNTQNIFSVRFAIRLYIFTCVGVRLKWESGSSWRYWCRWVLLCVSGCALQTIDKMSIIFSVCEWNEIKFRFCHKYTYIHFACQVSAQCHFLLLCVNMCFRARLCALSMCVCMRVWVIRIKKREMDINIIVWLCDFHHGAFPIHSADAAFAHIHRTMAISYRIMKRTASFVGRGELAHCRVRTM